MKTEQRKEYEKKWRQAHRKRVNEYGRNWKRKNPKQVKESAKDYYKGHQEERKAYRMKHRERARTYMKKYKQDWKVNRYGLGKVGFDSLMIEQNGVCAICLQPETRRQKTGVADALCIDHNHKTGTARGLLCHKCNSAIGLLQDDPLLLEKAKEYIIKWSKN